MALSKKDLLIHITLNELYNTHSLILQHIETLVSIRSSRALNLPLTFFRSPQTTSNTCAFSLTNSGLLQLRSLGRRTARSNSNYTAVGRRQSKISKVLSWIRSPRAICFTWRPSLFSSSLSDPYRTSLIEGLTTSRQSQSAPLPPRMLRSFVRVLR